MSDLLDSIANGVLDIVVDVFNLVFLGALISFSSYGHLSLTVQKNVVSRLSLQFRLCYQILLLITLFFFSLDSRFQLLLLK